MKTPVGIGQHVCLVNGLDQRGRTRKETEAEDDGERNLGPLGRVEPPNNGDGQQGEENVGQDIDR